LKSTTSTVGFLLLLAFIFTFCFNSCSPTNPDCFQYTHQAFRARINGEIDGEKFDATLNFDPSAQSSQPVTSVQFYEPPYMNGICISTLSDGSSSARLGDITVEGVNFERFTSPLEALCESHSITRIQKNQSGEVVVLVESDGMELEFVFDDKNGSAPKTVTGSVNDLRVELTVKKFEKK
jgi:hypothetical protein